MCLGDVGVCESVDEYGEGVFDSDVVVWSESLFVEPSLCWGDVGVVEFCVVLAELFDVFDESFEVLEAGDGESEDVLFGVVRVLSDDGGVVDVSSLEAAFCKRVFLYVYRCFVAVFVELVVSFIVFVPGYDGFFVSIRVDDPVRCFIAFHVVSKDETCL